MITHRTVTFESPRLEHVHKHYRADGSWWISIVPSHPRLYTETAPVVLTFEEDEDPDSAPLCHLSRRVDMIIAAHAAWKAQPFLARVADAVFGVVPLSWLLKGRAWACS